MEFPERLFDVKENEDGYGYRYLDETGTEIPVVYKHWYEGKKYILIWSTKKEFGYGDGETPPVVYDKADEKGVVHERIHDDDLIERIFVSHMNEVSAPLQTDRPCTEFTAKFMNIMTSAPPSNTQAMNPGMFSFDQPASGNIAGAMNPSETKSIYKFCMNCGTKRVGEQKFCSECGTKFPD